MTKSKTEPALQVAGAIHNTLAILANRVAERGGNLTEALVRLGMGKASHENSLNLIAGEFASISRIPKKAPEIVAPEGGRMHVLHVKVDDMVPWLSAINEGFPNTPSHLAVCRVGHMYRSSGSYGTRKIILVYFGDSVTSKDERRIRLWGLRNNLYLVNPRVIWAIGKTFPKLPGLLNQASSVIMTLMQCTYCGIPLLPYGRWDKDGERSAGIGDINSLVHDSLWFVFKEDLSV